MTKQAQPLISSFKLEYEQLRREFDKLEQPDSFQGPQMEALVMKFLDKWRAYLQEVQPSDYPNEVKQLVKHAAAAAAAAGQWAGTWYESLEDDLRLAELERANYACSQDRDSNYMNNYKQPELDVAACCESAPHLIMSDLYRRVAEATYLRLTYSKARLRREEDRREPVRWAQQAMRYNPHNFKANLWYCCSLGWCLDVVTNPRERILAGEAFKKACQRALSMEPRDALIHHLLGLYYYHLGELNWFQRSFAKNFLGCKIEGGYAEADHELRLAHENRPFDWLPTGLWMAKVLLAQGKPMDEVKHWVRYGLKLEANEPTTELERDELRELARKLKISAAANE